MGTALERNVRHRPKTFARYLRLCSRLAGVTDEIELEDALGIASLQVAMGRVPPPEAWVDGLIDQAKSDRIEAFF
jgi:hypothetical protein